RQMMGRIGGHYEWPVIDRTQSLTPQAFTDPFCADGLSLLAQRLYDASRSITAPTRAVNGCHSGGQGSVGRLSGTRRTCPPLTIAATRYAQHAAHSTDSVLISRCAS